MVMRVGNSLEKERDEPIGEEAASPRSLSPCPVRHAYASRGGSLRQHSIVLCTSAYKFLSNLH